MKCWQGQDGWGACKNPRILPSAAWQAQTVDTQRPSCFHATRHRRGRCLQTHLLPCHRGRLKTLTRPACCHSPNPLPHMDRGVHPEACKPHVHLQWELQDANMWWTDGRERKLNSLNIIKKVELEIRWWRGIVCYE